MKVIWLWSRWYMLRPLRGRYHVAVWTGDKPGPTQRIQYLLIGPLCLEWDA